MTRKEAIKIIEIIDLRYMTLDTKERQALRMAIKALEKEPVIDKIRAEIDSLHNGCGLFNDGIDKALDIIDKYKAESEDKK